MPDATLVDELSRRLERLLPPGLAGVRADLERNVRAAVRGALGSLDLVTREEFDVQAEVLRRTRLRLQALEARVAALEGAPEDGSGDASAPAGARAPTGGAPDAP